MLNYENILIKIYKSKFDVKFDYFNLKLIAKIAKYLLLHLFSKIYTEKSGTITIRDIYMVK